MSFDKRRKNFISAVLQLFIALTEYLLLEKKNLFNLNNMQNTSGPFYQSLRLKNV